MIAVAPDRVHAILVDPDRLADLTPLVQRIEADGDRWRWKVTPISAVGITAAPAFTTVLRVDARRIAFEPPPDVTERVGATGALTVERREPDGTRVGIDLVARVELPLPGMARRAVRSAMYSTMRAGGARFADNLLAHLGHPSHRGLVTRPGGTSPR